MLYTRNFMGVLMLYIIAIEIIKPIDIYRIITSEMFILHI